MTTFYKQCSLSRPYLHRGGQTAHEYHTAWIPEEFAKKGKKIDLLGVDWDNPNGWSRGWVVDNVFTRQSEEFVRAHEDDHKHQHKASDKLTPNKGLGIKR